MKNLKIINVAGIIALVVCLAGCQSMSTQEGFTTGVGVVAGGAAGAMLGSGVGSVGGGVIGAVVGGVVGNAIGRTMGPSDCEQSGCAFIRATRAPVGDAVYWRNGRTGNWGYYCPTRDGHTRMLGDYCREFITTTHYGNKMERTYATGCRAPNGQWYINPDN